MRQIRLAKESAISKTSGAIRQLPFKPRAAEGSCRTISGWTEAPTRHLRRSKRKVRLVGSVEVSCGDVENVRFDFCDAARYFSKSEQQKWRDCLLSIHGRNKPQFVMVRHGYEDRIVLADCELFSRKYFAGK